MENEEDDAEKEAVVGIDEEANKGEEEEEEEMDADYDVEEEVDDGIVDEDDNEKE